MHAYAVPKMIDETERERLILEHLPQVRLIARRIQERLPENISLEDLVSTGVLGLIWAIDNFDRIVQLEGSDFTRGSVTSLRYGLANRLYAKKTTSREILSGTISQSWYTDARAAAYDPRYQSSSYRSVSRTKFSAVAIQVRGMPTERFQADFRTEYHPVAKTLTTLAANGTISSEGHRRQAVIPASATEAPISLRKSRRDGASISWA